MEIVYQAEGDGMVIINPLTKVTEEYSEVPSQTELIIGMRKILKRLDEANLEIIGAFTVTSRGLHRLQCEERIVLLVKSVGTLIPA